MSEPSILALRLAREIALRHRANLGREVSDEEIARLAAGSLGSREEWWKPLEEAALEAIRAARHPICEKCGRPTTGTMHDKLCGGFVSVP